MPKKEIVDEAIASIPENYRLYTMDASIEGRFNVTLTLTEPDRQEWFDMGEVLDNTGRDLRPKLYVSGVSPTLIGAINEAIKETGNA